MWFISPLSPYQVFSSKPSPRLCLLSPSLVATRSIPQTQVRGMLNLSISSWSSGSALKVMNRLSFSGDLGGQWDERYGDMISWPQPPFSLSGRRLLRLSCKTVLNHSPYQCFRGLDSLESTNLIDNHLGKVRYTFSFHLHHNIPTAEDQIGLSNSRKDAHLRNGVRLQPGNQADQDKGLDHVITPFSIL